MLLGEVEPHRSFAARRPTRDFCEVELFAEGQFDTSPVFQAGHGIFDWLDVSFENAGHPQLGGAAINVDRHLNGLEQRLVNLAAHGAVDLKHDLPGSAPSPCSTEVSARRWSGVARSSMIDCISPLPL